MLSECYNIVVQQLKYNALYTHNSSSHAVQGGDGQWSMGRVGAAFREMFSMGRRRVDGSSDQLREVRCIVSSDNVLSNDGYHAHSYTAAEESQGK